MTQLSYNAGHWTINHNVFCAHNHQNNGLATWHGQTFGGQCAFALLGPDIMAPAGATHNAPTAVGPGWNAAWPHAGAPGMYFTQDATFNWKRGHLINGEWGGSGANWDNLTPLTSTANSNHKTIENRMRVLLSSFEAFERSGHQPYWYCIRYWVQVSNTPFAAAPAPAINLYSYAPNSIKITWRIYRLTKPVLGAGTTAGAADAAATGAIAAPAAAGMAQATNAQIAADLNGMPAGAPPACLPNSPANTADMAATALAVAGGAAPPYYNIPAGWPPIPAISNGQDGQCVIYQS